MPPNKASAGKRKKKDPELSQLLKTVLEKLGNDDTDSCDVASDTEDNGANSSRPRWSHVAPHTAFPPVKRWNKGKAPASTPPKQATLVVSPLEQVVVPEIPVPAVCAQPKLQGMSEGATMSTGLGVAEVLANIRKSLAILAPATVPGVPPTPLPGVPTPAALTMAPPTPHVPMQQVQVQDPSRQALLEVEALAVARSSIPLQAASNSPSVTPTPSAVNTANPLVTNVLTDNGKVPVKDNSAKEGTTDALLSRPGKLAAHVSAEVKERIWKGEFVDIFSLIRTKRTEVDNKEKEVKTTSSGDKKPKVEENIMNWLFGFDVFMSVMLKKKPDLGISMIYYANKILKAQHTYGGSAWLEYDRDFRWAKVEDPSIGWDQTEVNVWLECVNNKVPGRQPFRAQYSGEKK
ncbi:hypothetical protein NDU88_006028 [Pleurodeles waltl]|uniref:Uncharacterized protein n=1 Tax=Pleurodeles waltl TaxID=8319 RepID=A0AAV7WWE2_PLEWA|nr:hypothetical protein NDU88_006028 [Pleurodeles waltl]